VFFISALALQRSNNSKWSFVLVYRPADHGRSEEFLQELVCFVSASPFPVVVGGDFNLIRGLGDKGSGNINWPRVRRFNDALATMSLCEISRVGSRYTWTNGQLDPIRCVLDRVFVSRVGRQCFHSAPSLRLLALVPTITRSFCVLGRVPSACHHGFSSRPGGLRSTALGS
jgi:hypothetical protein